MLCNPLPLSQSVRCLVGTTIPKPVVMTGTEVGSLHLWDLHTRMETRRLLNAHRAPVSSDGWAQGFCGTCPSTHVQWVGKSLSSRETRMVV